jgi:hypothetical protein
MTEARLLPKAVSMANMKTMAWNVSSRRLLQ